MKRRRRKPNFVDMRGLKYGRWTVLREVPRKNKHDGCLWLCECSCGKRKKIPGTALRAGATKSCGCYQKFLLTKHGMSRSKEYYIWQGILRRCLDPESDNYENYGGRGINVCERWQGKGGFIRFLFDVGRKPHDGLSLDRIDNDGNYEPGNVRWATAKVQANNRRNSPVDDMTDYEEAGLA